MDEFITVALSEPVSYAKGGDPNNQTCEITLMAPTYGHRRFTRKIKQEITSTMMKNRKFMSSDEVKKEDKELQANRSLESSEVQQLLLVMDNYVDLAEEFENFISNSKNAVCYVDDGVHMTAAILQKIRPGDIEMALASYVANFIMPSLVA